MPTCMKILVMPALARIMAVQPGLDSPSSRDWRKLLRRKLEGVVYRGETIGNVTGRLLGESTPLFGCET